MTPPQTDSEAVVVTASSSTTPKIPYGHRGGQVALPSGSGITSLTWYTHDPVNDARNAAYEEDGSTAVAQTGLQAGRSYPIPAALFGAIAIYAVGNTGGQIVITRKS